MANLWLRARDPAGWAVLPLTEEAFNLSSHKPQPVPVPPEGGGWGSRAILIRADHTKEGVWVLIAGQSSDVRINGVRLTSGIRILADRDEIRIGSAGIFYFSAERLAAIEEFPGAESTAFCPRCKQAIELHYLSVKCPGCGLFYHQSEELPCWTYSETCALCPQPTAMDAGFHWTPEEL